MHIYIYYAYIYIYNKMKYKYSTNIEKGIQKYQLYKMRKCMYMVIKNVTYKL